MADTLTNGVPVRVILETTIVQEGEVFKHSFDEMGRIVHMNDNYYIRYTESEDEEEVATMIKLDAEGRMSVTRHGEETTKLLFDDQEPTATTYPTPAGIMKLFVETERLSISYTDQPFAGEAEVDYVLKMQGNPLGTYQMRLRFTT